MSILVSRMWMPVFKKEDKLELPNNWDKKLFSTYEECQEWICNNSMYCINLQGAKMFPHAIN